MNRSAWARILAAGVAIFCATCLTGVICYADDPDPADLMVSDDGGSDSDNLLEPATDTDLEEELNKLEEQGADMDGKVIFLQRGTVVVQNSEEDPPVLRAPVASSNEVGYVVHVTSSIGSTLLVPAEYAEGSFCLDSSGYLIGCRSSTFTCYMGEYTVRFPVYGQPQYRQTTGTGYTWNDIDLQYESSSSVEVIGAHIPWWSERFKVLILVATLFFVLILAFRRRD